MRSRIRSYFGFAVLAVLGAFAFMVLSMFLAKTLIGDTRTAMMVASLGGFLGMGTAVVSCWVVCYRKFRCPACEKSVMSLVLWNSSLFAGAASKTCPSCNVELFTPRSQRRMLILMVALMGMGFLGGIAASVSASSTRAKKLSAPVPPQAQQAAAVPAPG
jgi:hypothetical protein